MILVALLLAFAIGDRHGKAEVARAASRLAQSTNVVAEGNKWLHIGPATHEPVHVKVDLSDWIKTLQQFKDGDYDSISVDVCRLCFQPCGLAMAREQEQEARGPWPLPTNDTDKEWAAYTNSITNLMFWYNIATGKRQKLEPVLPER